MQVRRGRIVILALFWLTLFFYIAFILVYSTHRFIDSTVTIWTGGWLEGLVFSIVNCYGSGNEILSVLSHKTLRVVPKRRLDINSNADVLLVGSWWFARSDFLQFLCCLFMVKKYMT